MPIDDVDETSSERQVSPRPVLSYARKANGGRQPSMPIVFAFGITMWMAGTAVVASISSLGYAFRWGSGPGSRYDTLLALAFLLWHIVACAATVVFAVSLAIVRRFAKHRSVRPPRAASVAGLLVAVTLALAALLLSAGPIAQTFGERSRAAAFVAAGICLVAVVPKWLTTPQ